jgi:dihydroorotase
MRVKDTSFPRHSCHNFFIKCNLHLSTVKKMYDLIVKGGTVIDPSQRLEEKMDIAVSRRRVVAVEKNITSTMATKVVDASDKIVTPGLIDLHTHVYWGGLPLGIDPDLHCLQKGVTTVLDAGSAGCSNFLGFRKFIIEKCKTRVISLLHISSIGLIRPPELEDIRNLDYDGAVEVAKTNSDLIKGFKMRFASPPNNHVGRNGPVALRLIREAAEDVGGLIMVHPKSMSPNCQLEAILKLLRKGDIVTHCFSPPAPPHVPHAEILDDNGRVLQAVKKAADRGIVFDVGHGAGSFYFDTAQKALSDGFPPTTISTDLHTESLKTAIDMPTTMSKFLALGLSLSKVVEMSTTNPAEVLGAEGRLGTLKPGAEADIAVFDLMEGRFTFDDVRRKSLMGHALLTPYAVVKGGEIIS